MQIFKKIKLNHTLYFIMVDVDYKKKDGFPTLCLKNRIEDDWDGGDCSILIEEVEKSYTQEKAKQYDNNIGFMADVLYIYDRIPFISGVKTISFSSEDHSPFSESFITKEEIDQYIQDFHIHMQDHSHFTLADASTWRV